ncbi:MAG: aspartate 1-decarboxylase [Candidatus Omnitrophica bacterium]|nr:aspartate 1-decarboxylase [Candidatus Omnitrophota bacterium]
MQRLVCRSKIQHAAITKKELKYAGSIGIDKTLLLAADIYPNEVVQVLNVNNGNRFETYVIEEKAGSKTIALYGPAARMGEVGDPVVILSYGIADEQDVPGLKVKVVNVDSKNNSIKK